MGRRWKWVPRVPGWPDCLLAAGLVWPYGGARNSPAWELGLNICGTLYGSELLWITFWQFSCRMKGSLPLRLWRERILKRRKSWVLRRLINQVRKLDDSGLSGISVSVTFGHCLRCQSLNYIAMVWDASPRNAREGLCLNGECIAACSILQDTVERIKCKSYLRVKCRQHAFILQVYFWRWKTNFMLL